ncbi:hypothetical protein E5Q_00880 [Mixia osmundae IAM 14324]|uniref:Uncharacterized protein n=1 Tax=Mixia osmundae (strain CBS 9802 / IAM 14324 / JCM 22182 / KY 12970) TaxID=764103 RepID=G7DUH1_MIXOS|nr:hypothetical protein E5Q_00880 [Mixia osmundae IAM 14324]
MAESEYIADSQELSELPVYSSGHADQPDAPHVPQDRLLETASSASFTTPDHTYHLGPGAFMSAAGERTPLTFDLTSPAALTLPNGGQTAPLTSLTSASTATVVGTAALNDFSLPSLGLPITSPAPQLRARSKTTEIEPNQAGGSPAELTRKISRPLTASQMHDWQLSDPMGNLSDVEIDDLMTPFPAIADMSNDQRPSATTTEQVAHASSDSFKVKARKASRRSRPVVMSSDSEAEMPARSERQTSSARKRKQKSLSPTPLNAAVTPASEAQLLLEDQQYKKRDDWQKPAGSNGKFVRRDKEDASELGTEPPAIVKVTKANKTKRKVAGAELQSLGKKPRSRNARGKQADAALSAEFIGDDDLADDVISQLDPAMRISHASNADSHQSGRKSSLVSRSAVRSPTDAQAGMVKRVTFSEGEESSARQRGESTSPSKSCKATDTQTASLSEHERTPHTSSHAESSSVSIPRKRQRQSSRPILSDDEERPRDARASVMNVSSSLRTSDRRQQKTQKPQALCSAQSSMSSGSSVGLAAELATTVDASVHSASRDNKSADLSLAAECDTREDYHVVVSATLATLSDQVECGSSVSSPLAAKTRKGDLIESTGRVRELTPEPSASTSRLNHSSQLDAEEDSNTLKSGYKLDGMSQNLVKRHALKPLALNATTASNLPASNLPTSKQKGLAAILSTKSTGVKNPGLSRNTRLPALHRNLKPVVNRKALPTAQPKHKPTEVFSDDEPLDPRLEPQEWWGEDEFYTYQKLLRAKGTTE